MLLLSLLLQPVVEVAASLQQQLHQRLFGVESSEVRRALERVQEGGPQRAPAAWGPPAGAAASGAAAAAAAAAVAAAAAAALSCC